MRVSWTQISAPQVRAYGFVRKMRGGSQAALIATDQGHFVTKWIQNGQHRRVIVNEMICAELLKYLGISSPSWARIFVDEGFLKRHPGVRIELRNGYREVEPGFHFGSRYVTDAKHDSVHNPSPSTIMNRVSNWWDLLKAFVFDVWIDNHDAGQVVFSGPASGLRAAMIDYGYGLGFDGQECHFNSSPVRRPYAWQPKVYASEFANRYYQGTIHAIQKITREDLARLSQRVPPEWLADDEMLLSRQFDKLMDRGRRLPELVIEALTYLRTSGPVHRSIDC